MRENAFKALSDYASSKKSKKTFEVKINKWLPVSDDVLKKAIEGFKKKMVDEDFFKIVFVGDPELNNAACVIEEIKDDLSVILDVLDTPMGRLVSAILDKTGEVNFSFRAMGTKSGDTFEFLDITQFVVVPPNSKPFFGKMNSNTN